MGRTKTRGWLPMVLPVTLRSAVVVTCAWAATWMAYSPPAKAASRTGTLHIVVSGLPRPTKASVIVRGPRGFRRVVRSSTALTAPAGNYILSVTRVRLRHRTGTIPSGSVALPIARTLRDRVRRGRATIVRVRYGTIQSGHVHRLIGAPERLVGSDLAPSAIAVPFGRHPAVGSILTQAPSKSLPTGLFARVTAVKRSGSSAVLSLVPATLDQAFPELSVDTKVALQPMTSGAAQDAFAAGFSPLDLSFGNDFFRCGGAISSGNSFSFKSSMSVAATIDLHLPLIGTPHGQLSLELTGSQSLRFTVSGVHCDASLPVGYLQGVVLGVPVFVQVGVGGSLSSSGMMGTVRGSTSVSVGIAFSGAHVIPIHAVTPGVDSVVDGDGKLTIGPTLRLGIGAFGGNVHLDLSPDVAVTTHSGTHFGCDVDLEANIAGGLTFGPWELNEPATIAKVPLSQGPCTFGYGRDIGAALRNPLTH